MYGLCMHAHDPLLPTFGDLESDDIHFICFGDTCIVTPCIARFSSRLTNCIDVTDVIEELAPKVSRASMSVLLEADRRHAGVVDTLTMMNALNPVDICSSPRSMFNFVDRRVSR